MVAVDPVPLIWLICEATPARKLAQSAGFPTEAVRAALRATSLPPCIAQKYRAYWTRPKTRTQSGIITRANSTAVAPLSSARRRVRTYFTPG